MISWGFHLGYVLRRDRHRSHFRSRSAQYWQRVQFRPLKAVIYWANATSYGACRNHYFHSGWWTDRIAREKSVATAVLIETSQHTYLYGLADLALPAVPRTYADDIGSTLGYSKLQLWDANQNDSAFKSRPTPRNLINDLSSLISSNSPPMRPYISLPSFLPLSFSNPTKHFSIHRWPMPRARCASSSDNLPSFYGKIVGNGRYYLDKRIGGGAFGHVYRAIDLEDPSPNPSFCAIKCMVNTGLTMHERDSLEREITLHEQVGSHPNILKQRQYFAENGHT